MGLHNVCKSEGFKIVEAHNNEPCKGKDDCDRQAAVVKRYLNAYINSGNNVCNAQEMKSGILYRGGPKNLSVSVASVHTKSTLLNFNKIPGISTFHSASVEDNSVTFYKYYGIGAGKIVESNANFVNKIVTIEEFCRSSKTEQSSKSTIKNQKTSSVDIITPQTSRDLVINTYREFVDDTTLGSKQDNRNDHSISYDQTLGKQFFIKGWALPISRRTTIPAKSKKFIHELFLKGVDSKKKITPEEAHKLMKECPEFSSHDFLSAKQIKGLFGKYNQELKKSDHQDLDENDVESMLVSLIQFL